MNSNKIKLSSETNIATVSYQWESSERSLYVHILLRTETKLKTLNSTLLLQKLLYMHNVCYAKKGFIFISLGYEIDGISCDSAFGFLPLGSYIKQTII